MAKRKSMIETNNKKVEPKYVTYPVRIKVISQKGTCVFCHEVGDQWIYKYEPGKKPKTPDICDGALHTMSLYLKALWWGAPIPFPTPDPDTIISGCLDPNNPVVFELKRLRDQPIYYNFSYK